LGNQTEGDELIAKWTAGLNQITETARTFGFRPRVFFEEWNDPIISGIEWVEELIEVAGGEPIFPELRNRKKAKDRVVDWQQVVERDPDVIFASWCGMQVSIPEISARPNANSISAVRHRQVYEIPSSVILQPGPAALTEGVRQLHEVLAQLQSQSHITKG